MTTSNVQTVTTFVTPEAVIRMSNIRVLPKERKAIITLGTKEKGKRKFTEVEVEASITSELYDYLTVLKDDKVKVAADNEKGFEFIKTGTRSTSFQKFLAKKGIPFAHGVLSTIVFESDNTSPDYLANPFRLVMFNDRAVLTLVNIPSKSRKEIVDISTGEVKTYYNQKYGSFADGTRVRAFIRPEKYRRLVVQSTKEVEVIQ